MPVCLLSQLHGRGMKNSLEFPKSQKVKNLAGSYLAII